MHWEAERRSHQNFVQYFKKYVIFKGRSERAEREGYLIKIPFINLSSPSEEGLSPSSTLKELEKYREKKELEDETEVLILFLVILKFHLFLKDLFSF